MRIIWFIAGATALALGVLGIVLPLLPTVPFLLLAAFCFSKSSKTVHNWLINHNIFGPPIQDWRQNGAIRKPSKLLATLFIVASLLITIYLALSLWIILIQMVVLLCVAVFIWTRPSV